MNIFKTAVLMFALILIFVAIGGLWGGKSGMILAFFFATVMNFFGYWFSSKIVLLMYRAKEVSEADAPNLYAIVKRLIGKANLPMPKVYIIPNEAPNAFATGRNPEHAAVAVTQGILRILNNDELEGVLAHELAHVRNRDILIGTMVATIAGAITMIAHMARYAAIFGGGRGRDDREGGNPLALIIVSIIAPIAAVLIQLAISRSREYQADASGAGICGKPLSLARALQNLQRGVQHAPMDANPSTAHMFIVSPLHGGGILSLFSTHPPVEKRVEKLQEIADKMEGDRKRGVGYGNL
ncbi:MAG: zinc metalloprotease HtpX [Candidatus Omnitrophica bacterium]|nr:zinc metalloprotease HtpX [Candidatus Omnitrophota bacterium]